MFAYYKYSGFGHLYGHTLSFTWGKYLSKMVVSHGRRILIFLRNSVSNNGPWPSAVHHSGKVEQGHPG